MAITAEPSDFRASLRAAVDRAGPRILACLNSATAVVQLSWSEDQTVSVAFRDMSDEAAIDCARASVGPLSVPSGSGSGELLHAVSR